MQEIEDFFRKIFDSEVFMPRWVCGQWSDFHGWMYIISDLVIFLAYMAIPIAMLIFVRKRWNDVPFKWVFWLYILFITLCGITHFIDAVIFYIPVYRLNAIVLALTAIISMITVVAMIYVLPKALAYKSPVQLEQIVNEKTDQLKQQINELDALSTQISRKKDQLEHFAYIASHNLRAPAANLTSLIQMFDKTESQFERKEIADKISKSSKDLLDTIDDVSYVVKESSPQKEAKAQSFKKVIEDILVSYESQLSPDNFQLELDLKVEELVYPPDHFRSILQNLIDNAIKYKKSNEVLHLRISTFHKNNRVVLECADNGVGIDLNKHRDKVFKLYKTLTPQASKQRKGMGLFLVQNQLEYLNGFINLTSELGKGTTFVVTFGEVN